MGFISAHSIGSVVYLLQLMRARKPFGNWPTIIVAYIGPLKGDVWAWQWHTLPVTLIGVGNTTQCGKYSVIWMPTATGTWWISAGLAPFWHATDEIIQTRLQMRSA